MTRRRAVVGGIVALAAVILFWSWPREAVAPVVAVPAVSAPVPVAAESPPAVVAPAPAAAREPLAPVIDEILVEPPAVCDGEESLITVKAHTEGGAEDAYLHYAVGAELGARVALKVFATDDHEGTPPPLTVRVFGRNNVVTEKVVPPIRVLDCKPARRVHVSARLLPNTIDEFELTARIVEVGGGAGSPPMRPVEARWDFGDGSSGVSQGPIIVHDYSKRPQDALYSQLLVRCEVVGADGERVVGRTSLQLLNPSFEHLAYRGLVLLVAAMTPRFPEVGADGIVRQTVRVWHHHREAVTLTKVLRYAHRSDGGAEDGEGVAVDPVKLFGSDVVGAGGVEGRVELDARAGLFSYEYTMEGRTASGLPAMGAFSVLRPPDRPTKENSTPVVDPLLKAKILRARELLKQAYVTDEDLIRLGAQGAFDDLVKAAAAGPPVQGEAPMPPGPAK